MNRMTYSAIVLSGTATIVAPTTVASTFWFVMTEVFVLYLMWRRVHG